MKQLIGWAIVLFVFSVIFGITAVNRSLGEAILVWSGALIITFLIAIGFMLITGEL